MKTNKEILETYGRCCVSIHELQEELKGGRHYPEGETGETMARLDCDKIKDLYGQKKIIEWLFE